MSKKKQAKTIDEEISNLMKASDQIDKDKKSSKFSIASYRKTPVSQHSAEERKRYAVDLKKRDGSKFTKGTKVLINLRGKNVEAVIEEDITGKQTSLKVMMNGKSLRKDLATIYGIVGEKPEEAKPPFKLVELKKKTMPGLPRALQLEKQSKGGIIRAKTPPRTPRKNTKVSEGIPPKGKRKGNNTPRKVVVPGKKKKKCYSKKKNDGEPYVTCN